MTSPTRDPQRHNGYRVLPVSVIVAAALLLLAPNAGIDPPWLTRDGTWAPFMLIGAVPSLAMAYGAWRRQGRSTAAVAYHLLASAVVVLAATVFLARLKFAVCWPLFMLIGAACTLPHFAGHADCHIPRQAWRDDAESTRQ